MRTRLRAEKASEVTLWTRIGRCNSNWLAARGLTAIVAAAATATAATAALAATVGPGHPLDVSARQRQSKGTSGCLRRGGAAAIRANDRQ